MASQKEIVQSPQQSLTLPPSPGPGPAAASPPSSHPAAPQGSPTKLDQKKEAMPLAKGQRDLNPRLKLKKRMRELRKAIRQTDDPQVKKKVCPNPNQDLVLGPS